MSHKNYASGQSQLSISKGSILVVVLSAVTGGCVVAIATKAIPKMIAETLSRSMQKMMAQMEASGCSPSER